MKIEAVRTRRTEKSLSGLSESGGLISTPQCVFEPRPFERANEVATVSLVLIWRLLTKILERSEAELAKEKSERTKNKNFSFLYK